MVEIPFVPTEMQGLVTRAASAPQPVWTAAMLGGEDAFLCSPHADRHQLLESALAHGMRLANRLPQGVPVEDLVCSCGATVHWTERDPQVGPVLFQAEYLPSGARILLYRKALEPLAGLIQQCRLGPLLQGASPADVYTAHELYHHLAYQEGHPGWKVEQTYLRVLRRRISVRGLNEIAAHAFAQHLLRLDLPPVVLDYLSLIPFDYAAAISRLRQIASGEA